MAPFIEPSPAYVVLEAVRHTSNADIAALRQLRARRPEVLKLDLVLRILLTYLPEGTDPELYVDILRDLSSAQSSDGAEVLSSSPAPLEHDINEDEARLWVRKLHLTALVDPQSQDDQNADPLTLYLLRQAQKIDAETGSLDLVSQLLEPFVNHSEILRTWMISNLLPLLRLNYEYYVQSGPSFSLDNFEKLDGNVAIQSLLSRAAQRNEQRDPRDIGRDLRGLVGPWMYGENTRKRRKIAHRKRRKSSIAATSLAGIDKNTEGKQGSSEWSHVNEWLVDLGLRDFPRTVDAVTQWDGPRDVDYGDWGDGAQLEDEEELQNTTMRYVQACLATLYATNDSSLETIIGSHRILLRVAKLMNLDEPPDLKRSDTPIISGVSEEYLRSLSQAHLLHNAFLQQQNPFTSPGSSSLSLFNLFLASCYKLLNLGNIKTSRSLAELAIFGNEADQMAELRKTLHRLKAEKMEENVWASVRRQVLWLRNWEWHPEASEKTCGVFSKVAKPDVEDELLRAMVDGSCYSLAADIYCQQANLPLPMSTVEKTLLSAALSSYDAASNGNRTRGGVRKASDIISAFRNYFPQSASFAETSALLSATHAMSFYSLTLQHGVPFQPVNIRAHKDPMSLIGRILEQNPRSYTHLDDLLEIGQNLVAAGLTQQAQGSSTTTDPDQQALLARRRITRMAIEAALEEDDFETAYSYVINRLSTADHATPSLPNIPEQTITAHDDISWRAAYQAGRYPTGISSRSTLRRLEQRMELLSQALLLAPPSALSEVLTVWQKCEQEMAAQIAREAREEQQWNERGDRKVPGEFAADLSPVAQKARDPTRGALIEEAPIGLFDVARGAAAALSKNAFPLRGAQKAGSDVPSKDSHGRPLSMASAGSSDDGSGSGSGGTGRVRKRDMVSNMVTGGLASGIGWVIGKSLYFQDTIFSQFSRSSSRAARVNYEVKFISPQRKSMVMGSRE
ncbi:hypothetical protein MMC28_005114 [Mycoblastus sanguinarius]|nr:hypothetical protein [Mycoblastus sanguinarius]